MSSEPTVFELYAYPGSRAFAYPTIVTADSEGIEWKNTKGSGRIAYQEITMIALSLGEPDPDEGREDRCSISTGGGVALTVFCEMAPGLARKNKDLPVLRSRYSSFVRFLHQQLSPADRSRIVFKTDGLLTPKAQRFLVGGFLGSVAVFGGLFLLIGHPMAAWFGFIFFQVVYTIAILNLIPKAPLSYCPDPLDERYLPS